MPILGSLRATPIWMLRLAAAIALAAAFAIDRSAWLAVPILFVLVVPFEKLFPRHPQRVRRPHLALDVRYALLGPLSNALSLAVGLVVGLVSLAWLPGLALRPVVSTLPGWVAAALAFAVFDLLGYWGHRWMHEVPALWRFHSIHHSTEHLDWVSGFRLHPLDGIVIAPPAAFLLAAGLDVEVVGALAILQIVVGLFLHANVRWRLRPLQRIVATPEFHHWHHANEVDAHGTNYAPLLPVWDQVFGTYRVPNTIRPVRYGVDDPVPTTMRGQLRHPLVGTPHVRDVVRLGRDVWASTTRARTERPRPGDPARWSRTPPTTPRVG